MSYAELAQLATELRYPLLLQAPLGLYIIDERFEEGVLVDPMVVEPTKLSIEKIPIGIAGDPLL